MAALVGVGPAGRSSGGSRVTDTMQCDTCGATIDPETDIHVMLRWRVVAPEIGTESEDSQVLCGECGEVRVD